MATAAPTDPLSQGAEFAAQVSQLINKNLSEDSKSVIFDHRSQLFGLILLAKAIYVAHGDAHNVSEFKRMVDFAWKKDGLITVKVGEE